ncbi:MAG TPA: SPFH domain-containing protein [Stellaceae bacterium]|jgi:regulator of protease activity HflC (stomatin/prohibitin superfamily)|nr:SPFH domain-containing protein [Stellaceae bacterium]
MSATVISAPPTRSAFVDKKLHVGHGYVMLAIGLASIAVACWLAYAGLTGHVFVRGLIALLALIFAIVMLQGLVVLQPNESLVCLLFGSYVGTEHRPGFWWTNPFNSKRKISRRLETLESGPLKVNDAVGNPIDIGAVIVWRVEDAAKALLEVGSYPSYVKAQSETALRRMASVHPYDLVEADEALRQTERPTSGTEKPDDDHTPVSTVSLRDGGDAVIEALLHELRTRMEPIGVSVLEARISHLAYSSEIAAAMLRKQAASAVVAARRMVVKGAVSIVEDALSELDKKKLADVLDPERKAAMISNLLVVLVGDREVTPVINTGTLYS